ncbi:MAG TPA: hypothetical protein VJP88_05255 [Caulobacteraceae bacterium]|nr:hypothetical protein [Caulobacteraceae bacterium]
MSKWSGADNVLAVVFLGVALLFAEARAIPAASHDLVNEVVGGLLGYLAKTAVVAGASFLGKPSGQ